MTIRFNQSDKQYSFNINKYNVGILPSICINTKKIVWKFVDFVIFWVSFIEINFL